MSAIIGALRAELSASIAQFQNDMGKAADSLKGFSKQAAMISRDLENVGRKMSIAITAPLALLAKASLDQAKEAREAIGQVEAAIISSGGSVGRTVPQLAAMAKALQNISVFDDDDILRNVTANLVTFGNVQGPIFDRAQKAVVDLASRMGGDLAGAAIKVGRALNDPIGGVKSLTRLGISFTTQQQAQIKALVQNGEGLKAQGIILDALQAKFGGAAEALRAASPDAQLTQSWRDFKETLGAILIQVLPPLVDFLKDVLAAFQGLSPGMQKFIVVSAGILAVMGPLVLLLGTLVEIGGVLIPIVVGLAAAFAGLSWPVIAVVAAVAAAALAIGIFWKSVKDILAGNWSKAWEDAKNTVSDVAASILKTWHSLTAPTKIAAPVVTPPIGNGLGTKPGKLDFDQHNADTIKKAQDAARDLQNAVTQMNNTLAHGLDDLNLPKATSQANAFNTKIDDFLKKAQDAGVNTKAWAGQITALRARIEALRQAGLAKEAIDFGQAVDADKLAVDRFAKGGLPPLQAKLADVDDQFKQLTDKITEEIAQNSALADSNDVARKAMERLKAILAGLPAAHDLATKAAKAQAAAEQDLADLAAKSQMLTTANAIRDLKQSTGQGSPISSRQADLQAANDDLAAKQIEVATTLRKMEADREEAALQGRDNDVKNLDGEIALQQQLYDLVSKTTGEQIEAAGRINEAFKSFTDDLGDQLADLATGLGSSWKDVMTTFRTLAEKLFVKPITDEIADQIGGALKALLNSIVNGAASSASSGGGIGGLFGNLFGGGGASQAAKTGGAAGASGVGSFFESLWSDFSGLFAGGGYIPPGQWGIVGEEGPERAYGGTSGLEVHSNDNAMGGRVTQVFNISTPDANSFRRSQRQLQRTAKQRLAIA